METLHDLLFNSLVFIYKEKKGWKGPFLLIGITGEIYKVKLSSRVTNFWLIYVKLYYKKSTVGDFKGNQSNKE